MVHRWLVVVAAVVIGLGSAGAQTTGSCSDELSGERRASPVVLHFHAEQSTLQPDDEKKIAQLARLARSHQVQEICIQGFADPRGDAVASALLRHGVDPRTVVIDPKGETGTSIAGFLNEATGIDRRVEIRFSRY